MHEPNHRGKSSPHTLMMILARITLILVAIVGTSIPPARAAANDVLGNLLGEIPVVSAAGEGEWTQEAHDAQRTGYISEEPQEPWTLAWTFNGPDANGGTGGHMYNAPYQAHTVTGGANVYVPAGSTGLFALNKSNGAQAWRLTSPSFNATPAYDPASGALLAGGADGKLYKINGSTGQVQGTYDAGSPINKAVMLVGSAAYVSTDNGQLHKVNTANMTRAWSYATGSTISTAAAFSARAGVVILATRDLYVHAVKDADGTAQWRVKPTSRPAQDPFTFEGFWPVVAEQHGIVFLRLNLGWDALWTGPSSSGIYPSSNAETRALLQQNSGALENLFALDLANGSKKFIPAVGYGAVELRTDATSSGLFLVAPPVPVVKVNSDGSEVAYVAFRTGQGNPPDGRWDSYLGEMVLDNTTVSGLAAGDLRFMAFPNSYMHVTDEQTPLSMAGSTIFHAHWGASESASIVDRSASKGLTAANAITMKARPAVVRRVQSCANFDPKTHYTTCGMTLINDGRYWTGPGYWTYWNVNDPPTPVSNAYSDGMKPRYTYVSNGMMVVQGNGGDLMVFRYAGGQVQPTPTSGPQPTATRPAATNTLPAPTATRPAATATQPAPTQAAPTAAPTQVQPTAAPNPSGALTLNTYDDFARNTGAESNATASDINQGSITLAARTADEFAQVTLNSSLWTSGQIRSGAAAVSIAGSQLSVPGGRFVRSTAAFTRGSLQAVAQFERAAGQVVGFALQGTTPRNFLFTTQSGDGNLYALVNNNSGDQVINLGAILGGMHRYSITWAQADSSRDSISFFIDGNAVAQMTVPNAGAANWNLFLANNGTGVLRIDEAQAAPPYASSGSFTSATLDAGAGSVWQSISWTATVPEGTGLTINARTSPDGANWKAWSGVPGSGANVANPDRYLQFTVNLNTSNTSLTPSLDSITVNKAGGSAPTATRPAATATSPAPTATRAAATATRTPTRAAATATRTPTRPAATATRAAVTATRTPTRAAVTATRTPTRPAATATRVAPTSVPPTAVPRTAVRPTTVPPTTVPPTTLPPTAVPPTTVPPTAVPPTAVPPTQAPTQPAVVESVTFNSYDELKANCGGEDGVKVTNLNQGSILLAPRLADGFDQAALDAGIWSAGALSAGAAAPSMQNGLLTIPAAAFVRSNQGFTHGSFEALAELEPNSNQVIAFGGDQSTGVRYFMFTAQGADGKLYAMANNNSGDQYIDLGPVPTGAHHYRIEWNAADASTDSVSFLIDGESKATVTVPNAGATNWNLYLVNNGTGTMRVDQAQMEPGYVQSGVFTSSVLDAGQAATWQSLDWNAALQDGTSLVVGSRTSTDGNTWRDWTPVDAGTHAIANPDRFVQFTLQLSTSNENNSPVIDAITLGKVTGQAQPTQVAPTQPPATAVPPTAVPPTAVSPTAVRPTSAPPTVAPPTQAPTQAPTQIQPTATRAVTATLGVTPTRTSPTPTSQPPSSAKVSNLNVTAGNPAVYEKFEVQFAVQTSAKSLDMPFDPNPPAGVAPGAGITVNGLFSSDNWKTTIIQPGFVFQPYNHTGAGEQDKFIPVGKPMFAVRFAPQKAGSWQYRLSIQDAQGTVIYPATNQNALTFDVRATSSNPYANRGFVSVSPTDQRYFQYQNGEPFVGVGFNGGFNGSQAFEQTMTSYEQNKINFVRLWMEGSGMNGSHWLDWTSYFLSNDGYLPAASLDTANTYNGSPVSLRLDNANPCLFAGYKRGGLAVEPNTRYEITARIKTTGVTGSGDYGFVIKQGDWLGDTCDNAGTGTRITAPVKGDSDWTEVKGTYTTGSGQSWLGFLYLARENASGGQVYIDEVHMYRADDATKAELLRQPYANMIEHFDQVGAAQWDLFLQSAEKHGVYLKLVIDEKNEWIRNRIGADGKLAASSNDNFYAAPNTKVRWLEQAWWRYLIARWGYSTAVHSFEYINEGDPYNGNHYQAANAMAKYFDDNDPSRHMVTTSFWSAFPNAEFWSNPQFANIDYADVHAYVSTGWGPDASFIPAEMQETNAANVHSGKTSARLPGASNFSVQVTPRGVTIQGQGEWVIKYWMKASGLSANCQYSTTGSMARVRWMLDGGTYYGGREGVVPALSDGRDYVCTSPSGTFDWKQFSSTTDRNGAALPNTARLIVNDNNPHALNVMLENASGAGGTAWIDDLQIINPAGQVQPVIGTFETTKFADDTAFSTYAYSQIFGGGSLLGAHKPLVRGETGIDINNTGSYDPDMLKDKQGIWLHNNVWAQINSGGMYDMFWWVTETIPPSIYSNFLTYQNFMQGIPLNNGRYKDLGATTSNADLRVFGQRDDTAGKMHLWVQNAQHTWRRVINGPAVTAVSGTVTIPNVPTGTYTVEWWNTYTTSNPVFKTQTVNSNGSLVLTLPNALADDVAVKITKN